MAMGRLFRFFAATFTLMCASLLVLLPRLRGDSDGPAVVTLPPEAGRKGTSAPPSPDPQPTIPPDAFVDLNHGDTPPFGLLYLEGMRNWRVVTNLTAARIRRNQFVADCSTRRFVIAKVAVQGMMYNFLWFQDVMAYALLANRTMLVHSWNKPWSYARDPFCLINGTAETWNCFFEAVSNCPLPPLTDYVCWDSPGADAARVVAVGATPKGKCGFFVPHWLPTLKRDVAHKLDYPSRTQFLRFLFRPERRVREYIHTLKAALGGALAAPYHAIHVRVGDKHTENAPKELPRYLRQLRLLPATEPPITTVFLATDEPRVVEQATADPQGFTIVTNPFEERRSGGQWNQNHLAGSVNATAHVLNFLADVALLSEAIYFVGTQSSNVGNAVIGLMCARRGSISWPGCFANTLDGIKFSSANHPLLDGPRWNRDRGRCDVPRYRNVSFARPK